VFTGIVEELGEVAGVERYADSARLIIQGNVADASPGDSIAVNGVCLTIVELGGSSPQTPQTPRTALTTIMPGSFTADVMRETLNRSSLGSLTPGAHVNLERSVRLADRLGGHLVQGHVDAIGTIISRAPSEHWDVVRISLPTEISRYVVEKGSIAVDGISLTVSALSEDGAPGQWFEVSLIPETLKRTTLGRRQPGEVVNLEADVIAKYVERLVRR
jgi:riboflavin synthase